MKTWEQNRRIEKVVVGEELEPIQITLTLQRLVMEAGGNRDVSLIHHDHDAARATGARGAYANTYFLLGVFERLLREWIGIKGRIKSIKNLRMKTFNCAGDVLTFCGNVSSVDVEIGEAQLDLVCKTVEGVTVTANATVELGDSSLEVQVRG